jgi:hypothetical protein
MKRLSLTVALCSIVLAACGGARSTATTVVLWNPVAQAYLEESGSSGAVAAAVRLSLHSPGSELRVVRKARGRKACSFTHSIGSSDPPSLRKYARQNLTLSVYGNRERASAVCKFLKGGGFG